MQDHFLRYADLAEVMSSHEKMHNEKRIINDFDNVPQIEHREADFFL